MGRRIEKARDPKGTLRRLAAYLRPYALAIYGVLALVLVSTILSLAAPYLLGQAIDQLKDRPALLRSVLLMGGAYAGSWIADVAVGLIMASIAQNGLRGLRRDLFAHVQTLSLGFFDRHSHGDLMSRLTNDIDAISHALAMNVTQIISGSLTLVGILVLMFLLNFWLAVGSLAVLPLMLLLSVAIGRRTRQGFRGLQSEMGQLNGMMEETLSGQRVVVAFGHEKATKREFRSNQ
jgi:ATP-binding cassette subfamily B protein